MRAVVVEDEALLRLYFIQQLEHHGATVVGSTSRGAAAIELVRELHPDVVFLDIKLADSLSGVDVARLLEVEQAVKVVLMTAYTPEQLGIEERPSNIVAVLSKPITEYHLKKIIEDLDGI
jgi:two-component system LytT family response regulator